MGGGRNYGKLTPFAKVREDYNSGRDNKSERISQEKLAKMLNTNKSTISRIERGYTQPSPDILQGYSQIFNVSVDFLVGNTTPNKSNLNTKAYRELGLSDDAVETIRMITESSSGSLDISALLNAFLGGKENTVLFLQNLFNYLKNDDSDMNTQLLLQELKVYLHNVIRPQVQTALKKSERMDDFVSDVLNEQNLGN